MDRGIQFFPPQSLGSKSSRTQGREGFLSRAQQLVHLWCFVISLALNNSLALRNLSKREQNHLRFHIPDNEFFSLV
jgi:hypothetical protein